jgi:hypothetical protein
MKDKGVGILLPLNRIHNGVFSNHNGRIQSLADRISDPWKSNPQGRSVPDADLYRIQEMPPDDLGGASGEKRSFRVEFIGKTPNERFPYTVANEVVSSHIGAVIGFNIPVVVPHTIEGEPIALILWMKPAARQQQGPPLSSRELQDFLNEHEIEVHGAIVLDLYLGNTDRAFGPQRRNIAVDDKGRLLLFDFGNALFYRNREHLGIQAGIARLASVERDLKNMFDKAVKNPDNYYFQLLRNWEFTKLWCERVRQLPDFVLEAAVHRIPDDIRPPDQGERLRRLEFLKDRRGYLLDHIRQNLDLFPGLPRGGES